MTSTPRPLACDQSIQVFLRNNGTVRPVKSKTLGDERIRFVVKLSNLFPGQISNLKNLNCVTCQQYLCWILQKSFDTPYHQPSQLIISQRFSSSHWAPLFIPVIKIDGSISKSIRLDLYPYIPIAVIWIFLIRLYGWFNALSFNCIINSFAILKLGRRCQEQKWLLFDLEKKQQNINIAIIIKLEVES